MTTTISGDAPQFPPVARPVHTLLTEQDKAEGFEDDLKTTMLGETYNDSEISPDLIFIFVPRCNPVAGSDKFEFTEVLPGEYLFDERGGSADPRTVVVIHLWRSLQLLNQLIAAGNPFQFVAAPGTEREQRYRVASGGKLQKLGSGPSWSPFTLTNQNSTDDVPVITVESAGKTVIHWLDNESQRTGETSKGKKALLSRQQLHDLADIFYALSALTNESFELYGQVCGICAVCGRTLADATSIKRGVGPTCWKGLQGMLPRAQTQKPTALK